MQFKKNFIKFLDSFEKIHIKNLRRKETIYNTYNPKILRIYSSYLGYPDFFIGGIKAHHFHKLKKLLNDTVSGWRDNSIGNAKEREILARNLTEAVGKIIRDLEKDYPNTE